MTVQFRPAITSEAKPLIGLYSESGCGKTYSALLIARGFAGPEGKVGMIETEGGRGEAYADVIPGGYLVLPIRGSFAPKVYGEAITAAEEAKLNVLIIDSASHEWEGTGGVLAMAATNQEAGKKGVLVWQTPKIDHQRHFMGRLIATPIPLVIVCMRAKYPMVEQKKTVKMGTGIVETGEKQWLRSERLEPKQSEDILYEMFVHGWIDHDHRFRGTKYTRPDWREIIRDGELITLETGQRIRAWASNALTREADRPSPEPGTVIGSTERATAQRTAESGAPVARESLISAIQTLKAKLKPSAEDWAMWKQTYLGAPDANPWMADPAALSDLKKFMEVRAGTKRS